MHLEGPWLSTTGKKKGKKKFRNAEAAAKARLEKADWEDLKKAHGIQQTESKKKRGLAAPEYQPPRRSYRGSDLPKIPSLPFSGDACTRGQDKVYTGDAMLGIGQLHKSNAIPIFKKEDAIDIAKMRR
jgi:hypothetical protein